MAKVSVLAGVMLVCVLLVLSSAVTTEAGRQWGGGARQARVASAVSGRFGKEMREEMVQMDGDIDGSKRLSPGGPDSQQAGRQWDGRAHQAIAATAVSGHFRKETREEMVQMDGDIAGSKRLSPGGPDPQHH